MVRVAITMADPRYKSYVAVMTEEGTRNFRDTAWGDIQDVFHKGTVKLESIDNSQAPERYVFHVKIRGYCWLEIQNIVWEMRRDILSNFLKVELENL